MDTKELLNNIKVSAKPQYRTEESQPEQNQFVFSYEITIENHSTLIIKLLRRKWTIINSENEIHEVDGEGVVGLQPEIAPDQRFVYSSWCPLNTSWGTMEGYYTMIDQNGEQFEIQIPRFYLTME